MPLLSNDGFLTRMGALFAETTEKGSVRVTMKQGASRLKVSTF